jgi:hypothetical protein
MPNRGNSRPLDPEIVLGALARHAPQIEFSPTPAQQDALRSYFRSMDQSILAYSMPEDINEGAHWQRAVDGCGPLERRYLYSVIRERTRSEARDRVESALCALAASGIAVRLSGPAGEEVVLLRAA